MKFRLPRAFWTRSRIVTAAVAAFALLTTLLALVIPWNELNSYQSVNNSSLHYVKGRVDAVLSENLTQDELEPGRNLGSQKIRVTLLEGENEGAQVEINNVLSYTQNVEVHTGQTIIVCEDTPESAEAYYTVYNYYRSPAVFAILAVFAMIVLVIGAGRGARSLLGLAYTVLAILLFLLQAIFHGFSPVWTSVLVIAVTTVVVLLLLAGWTKKATVSIAATLLGVGLSGVLYQLFCAALHLSGYNSEEAESLLLVTQYTGLEVKSLLLVGVLIAALGAVMDVAMSLASSLDEIHRLHPQTTWKQLWTSGLNIGKDMIGTMTNTLILAYTGSALTTMLVLMGYGYTFQQLLNSDYLALELAQGIASTGGVVLTVPAATAIAGWAYTHRRKSSRLAVVKEQENPQKS